MLGKSLDFIKGKISKILIIGLLLLPILVLAQDEFGIWETAHYALPTNLGLAASSTDTPSIVAVIATVIQIILGVVGVVLLIMILYGGFMWITSSGNEQKIAKAKAIFGGALIGLVIILTAYVVTSFIMRNLYLSIQPMPAVSTCRVDSQCPAGYVCTPENVCLKLTPEGNVTCPGVCLTYAQASTQSGCGELIAGRAFCEATNSAWSCFVAKPSKTCVAP